MGNNDMSEFTGVVVVATKKAYLIDIDGDEVWLPDSMIDFIDEPEVGEEVSFEIPTWLAEDKALI